MFRTLLIVGLVGFFLVGCETKRQNFEPEATAGKVRFDKDLPGKIINVTRHGATLDNGQIITDEGLRAITLPEGFILLGEFDGHALAAAACGTLKVLNASSDTTYERTFEYSIASASLEGNLLAIVDSTNQLMLLDISTDEVLFSNKQDDVYALDSRMAAPYFLNSLVLYPTLDGKVVIVDKASATIVRDVVVSSEQFFNNVIFLDVVADRMVVATAKRVISINPNATVFMDEDVKDVIVLENRVFVFTKDGRVVLADADLNVLKERKFTFAVFSGAIHGEFVYIVEKGGYLIATDLELMTTNVYELPSDIDTMLFATKDTLYIDDQYFQLGQRP